MNAIELELFRHLMVSTVRGQLGGPVVCSDDHVRPIGRRDRAECRLDRAEILGHDLDRRAVRGCPGVCDLCD